MAVQTVLLSVNRWGITLRISAASALAGVNTQWIKPEKQSLLEWENWLEKYINAIMAK